MKTKIKKLPLLLLLVYSYISYGQYNTYEFKEVLNTLITEKRNEAPIVFKVNKTNISTATKSKKKVETKLYKELNLELQEILKDSIKMAENNQQKTDSYKNMNTAKEYINQFISSAEPFEVKKEKLIKAQKIVDRSNLDLLIYSDEKINPENKSKFFILKIKSLDLKVHLKKIVWQIESKNKKPVVKKPFESEKAKEVRKKLKSIKRYEFIDGPMRSKKISTLALGEEITRPDDIIDGVFKNRGEYYVIAKKTNNRVVEQLVSVEKIKSMDSKSYSLVFDITATLIQKLEDNSQYLVASGFINEYSLTKLSQSKKFKDKVKLPFKIYSTVNDRLIDSIILNHNIGRLSANLK